MVVKKPPHTILHTFDQLFRALSLDYLVKFACMSLYDNFQKMVPSENQFSWWQSNNYLIVSLVLGGQVHRLYHGPIWLSIQLS